MWKVTLNEWMNEWMNFKEQIQKFLSLVLHRNAMLQHSISALLSVKLLFMIGWKQYKTSNFFALKVVAVAFVRWSVTGGSKYSDLTWKLTIFWKTDQWGEVVAYESWSQPKVQLNYLGLDYIQI